jgi:hemerythrin superfamily protein
MKKAAKKSARSSRSSKSTRGRAGTKRASQDAVALLKADHRKVEGLFKRAEKAKGSTKEALVEQICNELIIHTMLEEEIFYPACRGEDVEEDMMDEAQVEHDGAKVLINDVMEAGSDSPMYDAKIKVLSEYIKHHVKEEEKARTGVFAEAKRKGVDVTELGAQIKARKAELMEMAKADGLPRPEPKSIGSDSQVGARASRPNGSSGGMLKTITGAARRATLR